MKQERCPPLFQDYKSDVSVNSFAVAQVISLCQSSKFWMVAEAQRLQEAPAACPGQHGASQPCSRLSSWCSACRQQGGVVHLTAASSYCLWSLSMLDLSLVRFTPLMSWEVCWMTAHPRTVTKHKSNLVSSDLVSRKENKWSKDPLLLEIMHHSFYMWKTSDTYILLWGTCCFISSMKDLKPSERSDCLLTCKWR